MNESNGLSSGGIVFAGLLTVMFIGLKLTHYIDWSWWWVLSPLWIGFSIDMIFVTFFLLCFIIFDR